MTNFKFALLATTALNVAVIGYSYAGISGVATCNMEMVAKCASKSQLFNITNRRCESPGNFSGESYQLQDARNCLNVIQAPVLNNTNDTTISSKSAEEIAKNVQAILRNSQNRKVTNEQTIQNLQAMAKAQEIARKNANTNTAAPTTAEEALAIAQTNLIATRQSLEEFNKLNAANDQDIEVGSLTLAELSEETIKRASDTDQDSKARDQFNNINKSAIDTREEKVRANIITAAIEGKAGSGIGAVNNAFNDKTLMIVNLDKMPSGTVASDFDSTNGSFVVIFGDLTSEELVKLTTAEQEKYKNLLSEIQVQLDHSITLNAAMADKDPATALDFYKQMNADTAEYVPLEHLEAMNNQLKQQTKTAGSGSAAQQSTIESQENINTNQVSVNDKNGHPDGDHKGPQGDLGAIGDAIGNAIGAVNDALGIGSNAPSGPGRSPTGPAKGPTGSPAPSVGKVDVESLDDGLVDQNLNQMSRKELAAIHAREMRQYSEQIDKEDADARAEATKNKTGSVGRHNDRNKDGVADKDQGNLGSQASSSRGGLESSKSGNTGSNDAGGFGGGQKGGEFGGGANRGGNSGPNGGTSGNDAGGFSGGHAGGEMGGGNPGGDTGDSTGGSTGSNDAGGFSGGHAGGEMGGGNPGGDTGGSTGGSAGSNSGPGMGDKDKGGGNGGGGGGERVLCGELCRQGLLPRKIYVANLRHYKIHGDVYAARAYHAWAIPMVARMQKSKTVTKLVQPWASAWAYEMAYEMGVEEKHNPMGWVMMRTLMPLHSLVGRILYKDTPRDYIEKGMVVSS